MADSSPMATLLGRAGNVFSLARELGQKFQEEGQSRAIYYDPSIWDRLRPTFDEFWAALLDLRDAMQRPPDGFEAVADQLKTAAKIARGIQAAVNPKPEWESWSGRTVGKMFAVKDPGPPEFTAYLDFFPQLNTVAYDGWQAVKQAKKAQRLDDPFAFVDDPTNGSTAEQPWTLLDRFPATPDGHIAFLEFVRDEVHNAADAKRQRLAREYTNATIESMVGGIKWAEARERIATLPDLPTDAGEQVDRVLRRELTIGTIEQIDDLLDPAVRALRDAWGHFQDSGLRHDLKRFIGELAAVLGDRETSVASEPAEPSPIRGSPLYEAEQAVERHFPDGKLPVQPWREWRGMLRRADEGQGEPDKYERYERFYECGDALQQWAEAEMARLQTEKRPAAPESTGDGTKSATTKGKGKRRETLEEASETMPRFLHEDDALLQRTIEKWKQTAAHEVDDIGGWREATDDPPDPMPSHVYARLVSGQGWDKPPKFYSDTTYLVGRITAHYPKLDPAPLQDVYSAVDAWHEDHNARRVPGQAVLTATLDRAMMTLQAIEADIQNRVVGEDDRQLIQRLLAATEPPKLFADDLARLRAYLKPPMSPSRLQSEPAERENRRKLQEILAHNEQLQSNSRSTRKRKRPGRHSATPEEIQKEADLVADWVTAKAAGVYKPDFVKEKKITMGDFKKIYDRVTRRNKRLDK